MMDSITFQIDDAIIQIANGDVRFWQAPVTSGLFGYNDNEPDIVIPLSKLRSVLHADFMLKRGAPE